jgi:hypothetical protein
VNATACEDRGADLFLIARGGTAPPDVSAHVASCAGCRTDLERLRALAKDLPEASAGLAPRPATRVSVLREVSLPAGVAAPPPPRALPRRGPFLRLLLPLAAAAAGLGITVFVLSRQGRDRSIEAPGDAVEVTAIWNGAALDGIAPEGLRAGHSVAARKLASVRLGPPVAAEVVLAEGTRLSVPPGNAGRAVELQSGLAWFDPGTVDPRAAARGALRVRAGDLEVEERGARFTVERRASGAAVVYVETGVATLRSGGAEATASGPCRVDVPAGGKPSAPVAVEPGEATGWFSYPEVSLELVAAAAPGSRNLVVVLRPALPRPLRIAPWSRMDPVVSFQAAAPGKRPVTLPLRAEMCVPPLPPSGGPDGAFLLSGDRPYRITVDAASLGLAPGTYGLTAVYASNRPGGLWRGTRASNVVEFNVE